MDMAEANQRRRGSGLPRKAWYWLGGIVLSGVLLMFAWWQSATTDPQIVVPTPVMPNPNAFVVDVAAGNAMVSVPQLRNAFSNTPTVKITEAQKVALVKANQGAIRLLHQGFAYPYENPPIRSFNTLLPYYSSFRDLSRLLALQAQTQAARNDWNGAMNSSLDALQFGEEIPHGGTIIGSLVGDACQAIGERSAWKAIDHLNGTQARAATQRVEAIRARHVSWADTVQEEKWATQAGMLEWFRSVNAHNAGAQLASLSGNSSGSSVQTFQNLYFLFYGKRRIMSNYTHYIDQTIADARKPYQPNAKERPIPKDPLCQILMPVFSKASLKEHATFAESGLLLVALALRAYQADHGHYPDALAELSPAYLKQLPQDPFAPAGTFQYRRAGNTYLLYSIGADGKDDGGKPIDNPSKATATNPDARYSVQEDSIGDIVAGKNL